MWSFGERGTGPPHHVMLLYEAVAWWQLAVVHQSSHDKDREYRVAMMHDA